MSELNREQIIKALECCATDDDCAGEQCPFYADCQFCITRISKDALDLIKELTKERTDLLSLIDAKDVIIADLNDKHNRILEENERLRATQVVKHIHIDEQFRKECEYEMKQIKSDTVREMRERLHERFKSDPNLVYSNYNIHRYIDQIAKEMLEGVENV